MGSITLDFDRILIFGGEKNSRESNEAYIYNFYEQKVSTFTQQLEKPSKFIVNPVYYNGRYILLDNDGDIHEFNLDTFTFEYNNCQGVEFTLSS